MGRACLRRVRLGRKARGLMGVPLYVALSGYEENLQLVTFLLGPSFSESAHRGQKEAICEELSLANLLSKKLTWANEQLYRVNRPYLFLRTHISPRLVPEDGFSSERVTG